MIDRTWPAYSTGTPRPDFFIVGQPKAGTTALYKMLRTHPGLYMPDLKEPNFFCTDLVQPSMRRRGMPYFATVEEYVSLFSPALPGQRIGEASVHYLQSRVAARNIATFNPEARIVAILREPASLLRSLHLQLLQSGVEREADLATALCLEEERRKGRAIPRSCHRPQLLLYSEVVRYVDQLQRFRELFRPDRMLIAIYDDFLRDNEGTVRSIFRFLGLDDSVDVVRTPANPSVFVRAPAIALALHRISVGRDPFAHSVKRAIKGVARGGLARWLLQSGYRRVTTRPPPPDQAFMRELRRRYASEVERLSAYLGRDLVALWIPED